MDLLGGGIDMLNTLSSGKKAKKKTQNIAMQDWLKLLKSFIFKGAELKNFLLNYFNKSDSRLTTVGKAFTAIGAVAVFLLTLPLILKTLAFFWSLATLVATFVFTAVFASPAILIGSALAVLGLWMIGKGYAQRLLDAKKASMKKENIVESEDQDEDQEEILTFELKRKGILGTTLAYFYPKSTVFLNMDFFLSEAPKVVEEAAEHDDGINIATDIDLEDGKKTLLTEEKISFWRSVLTHIDIGLTSLVDLLMRSMALEMTKTGTIKGSEVVDDPEDDTENPKMAVDTEIAKGVEALYLWAAVAERNYQQFIAPYMMRISDFVVDNIMPIIARYADLNSNLTHHAIIVKSDNGTFNKSYYVVQESEVDLPDDNLEAERSDENAPLDKSIKTQSGKTLQFTVVAPTQYVQQGMGRATTHAPF